jgi:hypothetical protein
MTKELIYYLIAVAIGQQRYDFQNKKKMKKNIFAWNKKRIRLMTQTCLPHNNFFSLFCTKTKQNKIKTQFKNLLKRKRKKHFQHKQTKHFRKGLFVANRLLRCHKMCFYLIN